MSESAALAVSMFYALGALMFCWRLWPEARREGWRKIVMVLFAVIWPLTIVAIWATEIDERRRAERE